MTTKNDQPSSSPVRQDVLNDLAISLKLSQDLLLALHEESSALRAMDTQGLFRISRHKDSLLTKIQYLDNMVGMALAERAKDTTTAGLTAEESRMIGQYKSKINLMRQEIQARNLVNKRFTEDTLGYLREAIGLFTRPLQDANTYHVPGRSQARGKYLPSFISREV